MSDLPKFITLVNLQIKKLNDLNIGMNIERALKLQIHVLSNQTVIRQHTSFIDFDNEIRNVTLKQS